ncbi:hypothetical protein [Halorarius halobius]|uniref:hypothetical protein n=1 Tax=Halorarius halobius TaxID=2962671 RepID=UPI0020CEE2A3|nr:hypothetical protein [Halorarius halobius]
MTEAMAKTHKILSGRPERSGQYTRVKVGAVVANIWIQELSTSPFVISTNWVVLIPVRANVAVTAQSEKIRFHGELVAET